ncbi:hypothetical protein DVH05_011212 [Phytophthora capsici]|nr:hypothetical protein DVH05_011212 [Phytophthora capsici]
MGPNLQLAIARCILRGRLPPEAVETVAAILSNFLVVDMTLARACEISHTGVVELPMLMWSRSQLPCDEKWSGLKLLHSNPRYFHQQFTQALIQSIRRGDLKLVQWLLSQLPEQPTEDVVEEIVETEQMKMIQLFEEKHVDEIMDQAAKSGRWDLVHRLYERTSSHSQWHASSNVITHEAIYQNKLKEVKWAFANGFWLGEIKLNRSPEAEWPQRKEVLLYLLEREKVTVRAAVRQAAEAGDIPFLEWFMVHNQPGFPSEAMFAAAGAGQLDVVKYLYEEYHDDPNVVLFREGEVVIPRQVREDNFFRPSTTMDVAV